MKTRIFTNLRGDSFLRVIEIIPEYLVPGIEYFYPSGIRIRGGLFKKSQVYYLRDNFKDYHKSPEELLKYYSEGCIKIKDSKLYYRSCVVLHYENGLSWFYFDTIDDLREYLQNLSSRVNLEEYINLSSKGVESLGSLLYSDEGLKVLIND